MNAWNVCMFMCLPFKGGSPPIKECQWLLMKMWRNHGMISCFSSRASACLNKSYYGSFSSQSILVLHKRLNNWVLFMLYFILTLLFLKNNNDVKSLYLETFLEPFFSIFWQYTRTQSLWNTESKHKHLLLISRSFIVFNCPITSLYFDIMLMSSFFIFGF